jgi:hypothetical protein
MYDATTPVEVDLDPDDGIIAISRRGTCLPLTLTEAHQVICRLTGILLRQHPTAGPAVDLAVVEQVLYREPGVIDPRDVPALLATIAAHTTTTTQPAEPAEPAPPPGWWS